MGGVFLKLVLIYFKGFIFMRFILILFAFFTMLFQGACVSPSTDHPADPAKVVAISLDEPVLYDSFASLDEGDPQAYSITLSGDPSLTTEGDPNSYGKVNIEVCDQIVLTSPNSFAFDAGNWNTAQTISFTVNDDLLLETNPHFCEIRHIYEATGVVTTMTVEIVENDFAGYDFTFTATDRNCDRGGMIATNNEVCEGSTSANRNVTAGEGTLTVAKTFQIPEVVTTTINIPSGLRVVGGGPNVVTFAANEPVATVRSIDVEITPARANASVGGDENVTFTASTASENSFYNDLPTSSLAAQRPITIKEDDANYISITPSSTPPFTTINEGTDESFVVRLHSEPNGDVDIDLSASPTGGATALPLTLGAIAFPRTAMFTTANWAPQTITVSPRDDGFFQADMSVELDFNLNTVSSTATNYTSSTTIMPTMYTINVVSNDTDDGDPDGYVFTFMPANTNCDRGGTIAANQICEGSFSSDRNVTAGSGTLVITKTHQVPEVVDATISIPSGLRVASGSSNMISFPVNASVGTQRSIDIEVTPSRADASAATGNETVTFSATTTSTNPFYNALQSSDTGAQHTISIIEDDENVVTVTTISPFTSINEGSSRNFTVRLHSEPDGNATVNLNSSAFSYILPSSLFPRTAMFTTTNWGPKTITLSAGSDSFYQADISTNLTFSITGATGSRYTSGTMISPMGYNSVIMRSNDAGPPTTTLSSTNNEEVRDGTNRNLHQINGPSAGFGPGQGVTFSVTSNARWGGDKSNCSFSLSRSTMDQSNSSPIQITVDCPFHSSIGNALFDVTVSVSNTSGGYNLQLQGGNTFRVCMREQTWHGIIGQCSYN